MYLDNVEILWHVLVQRPAEGFDCSPEVADAAAALVVVRVGESIDALVWS